MNEVPSSEELLARGLNGAGITLDILKSSPDFFWQSGQTAVVQLARSDANGRFAVAPPDVAAELCDVAAELDAENTDALDYPFQLIPRRMRDLNGSIGMEVDTIRQRNRYNPLRMNPIDMDTRNLKAGDAVQIDSDAGSIVAIVQPDTTLRSGVVSMSHNWGRADNNPEDYAEHGASTNILIRNDAVFEVINAMPRMSAIPVAIARVGARSA